MAIILLQSLPALVAAPQGRFNLPEGVNAVIPFSDGLDSRIVAGLMARDLGDKLIRVRLGSKTSDARRAIPVGDTIHVGALSRASGSERVCGVQCAVSRVQVRTYQRIGRISGEGGPNYRS